MSQQKMKAHPCKPGIEPGDQFSDHAQLWANRCSRPRPTPAYVIRAERMLRRAGLLYSTTSICSPEVNPAGEQPASHPAFIDPYPPCL